uniref:Reverse transcriptase domain-containing protein n=1 Tax=Haemonchus contortus TaxID=6289 RepID=A0A7I4YFD5_HAECO
MPRLKQERSWRLFDEVPPNLFSLVREAVSLRQKVVATRQSLKFLQRCRTTGMLPRFIFNKKIGSTCGLSEDHPKITSIYRSILSAVIKEKQRILYSSLLKCISKERACQRLLRDQTWRRIEGESRRICNSIRSAAKSTLCAKYERLCKSHHENAHSHETHSTTVHHHTSHEARSDGNLTRVTVLGNTHLSSNALDVLSLGPSFAPAQNVNAHTFRQVVGGLQRFRDLLRTRSRRDQESQTPNPNRNLITSVPFPRNFYKEPPPVPEADVKFKILSAGVLTVLNQNRRLRSSNLTYKQRQGLKELRELRSNGTLRITVSDKGGEFVVMSQTLDRAITELHLSDSSVYRRVTEKDFSSQCSRLNHIWLSVAKSAGIDEKLVSRLKLDSPNCPVFYSLIKTHKLSSNEALSTSPDTFKIRPIISCVGGPTDRISWFLNSIVSQLLPMVPSHLPSTKHFLELLHSSDLGKSNVIESFDVVSLYTNVQNEHALQALSEMLDRHANNINTFGLSKMHIMTLVKECLMCNIFKWAGKYFSQVRGLAMGQRLAPVLAVCFMGRIEEPVLERNPLMYCRYIDDCFIVTSTQFEMDECFRIMNEQSQYIKLTREVPRDGWLPYLNTQVKVSSGVVSVKWYRKTSSKNILLHATSAHPQAVKRAVVSNMLRTATSVCTGEAERLESRRLACEIAAVNGYTVSRGCKKSRTNTQRVTPRNKLPLCLPFISDKVSNAIQRSIFRAGLQDVVQLVNIPNNNIKQLLVRNRLYDKQCITKDCIICPYGKTGDCALIGVIYQIECRTCGSTYIGETGRQLATRIKEHLASMRRGSLITALGRHKIEEHNGDNFEVKCTILAQETEISARKALEAFWIFKRNPEMNGRDECPSITNDLLPYIPHCDL